MSDKPPNEGRGIETQGGSYFEGGVRVEGSGRFVGGNLTEGLDVAELVAALKQAFPTGDTRPERFSQLLAEFQRFHAQLHEWKELHNALNRIIDAFDQYAGQVNTSYNEGKPLQPVVYREAWRPVGRCVDDLLEWARTVRRIGKPYRELDENRLEGEAWAIDIEVRRSDLSNHFQQGQLLEQRQGGWRIPQWIKAHPIHDWLRQLYDLTHEFDDATKRHMSRADHQLRQTASDLYNLSQSAFGRQA